MTSENNMKFCVKKVRSLSELKRVFNSNCREEDFLETVTFNYSDTFS